MILQFGAGNFLRAFVDLFATQLNRDPATEIGPVVVVQSTGRERADALNRVGCRYHVVIRGFRKGALVDAIENVDAIREVLHAGTQWSGVLDVAKDASLSMIVSNTTEAGLSLDPADNPGFDGVPLSFPAKLLAVLLVRFAAGGSAPWILPCELVENNATVLRELVLEQAARWSVAEDALAWIREECRWVNTLVDRIVPGTPVGHPLLAEDPLLLSAEPFAFWAIELSDVSAREFPLKSHPAVAIAADIGPFALRKVRVLNGAHSAMVCRAQGTEVETVREFVEHPQLGPWLEELLFGEIVPVLEGRCDDPAKFARETLDRFRNPFLEHRLAAIALNHEAKVAVRLRPTLEEYREKFGKAPVRLSEILR
ncbi:MAG: altronate dehydrogenase [Verrucomicrobiae bacterium]|nr:altronate dehydrogenase [Verrucomicrobiae bacterium]